MAMLGEQEVEQLVIDFQGLSIKAASPKVQDAGKHKQSISHGRPGHRGLVELPAELLNKVLLLVRYSGDQAALARTCKRLRDVVVPMLYHDANLGLPHLESLTLIPDTDADAKWVVWVFLSRLATAIPKGRLRRLRCDQYRLMLEQRVREVPTDDQHIFASVIALDVVSVLLDRCISECDLSRLARCDEIVLYSEKDWKAFRLMTRHQDVVWSSKTLQTILVDSDPLRRSNGTEMESRIHAYANMANPLTYLFDRYKHNTGSGRGIPDLTIRHGDFAHPGTALWQVPETLMQAFSCMNALVLQDCLDCATLLQQTTFVHGPWCLSQLTVISSGEPAGTSLLDCMEALLSLLQGLRTLLVSSHLARMPKAQAITHHGSSLKELFIGISDGVAWDSTSSWIESICRGCPNLEQVALPTPNLRLEKICFANDLTPRAAYNFGKGSFPEVMSDRAFDDGSCEEFAQCVSSIRGLRKLVTLRMIDVEAVTLTDFLLTGELDGTQRDPCTLLAHFVVRQLHEVQHSQLSVVSFAKKDGAIGHFLIRGPKLVDLREKLSSIQLVSRIRAQSEEPRPGILDVTHDGQAFLRFP